MHRPKYRSDTSSDYSHNNTALWYIYVVDSILSLLVNIREYVCLLAPQNLESDGAVVVLQGRYVVIPDGQVCLGVDLISAQGNERFDIIIGLHLYKF